ncbi:MAG TPA: helix-turn-helix transcriptional regulator [Solirubrobacterales bacterium]|nr:helix-turn-helix transcriptional regulator [Solirubrobacterales bacterium]
MSKSENRLRVLREGAGLERRDLAVALDVTEDTIRRLENPATEIPSKYIPTLAGLVEATERHLMGWDRQPLETGKAA